MTLFDTLPLVLENIIINYKEQLEEEDIRLMEIIRTDIQQQLYILIRFRINKSNGEFITYTKKEHYKKKKILKECYFNIFKEKLTYKILPNDLKIECYRNIYISY